MKVCHNTLIAVACVSIAILGCVSVATSHDNMELAIAAIVGLAGVAAPVTARFQQTHVDSSGSTPQTPYTR